MFIDKALIARDLHELCSIGANGGEGVSRLGFTEEERELHHIVARRLEEAGATVRWDTAGNLIARRHGHDDSLPVVACGSHLDSVPNGGSYDGVVGVLAGVAALRGMKARGLTTLHPVEVIAFACEESSRFGLANIGSKAVCGLGDAGKWSSLKDKAGVTLGQAMDQVGLTLAQIGNARRRPEEFKAYIEMHIEQGRVLEEARAKIGIVTSIAAPTRFRIVITGRADHSGATPMGLRKDALAAAAEVVSLVERCGQAEAGHHSVATVGILKVEPGVMNVIPGRAELGIDVRGIDDESIARVVERIHAGVEEIRAKRGVLMEIQQLTAEKPVPLSPKIISVLKNVCDELQIPHLLMPSGAGHDAMYMSRLTDTGMLFIPCQGGISHNPAEEANLDDIALGAEVLVEALLGLAGRQTI